MANFQTAYSVVRQNEGGYANNKKDRGGETYKGIARNSFPAWAGWRIVDYYKDHVKNFEASLEKDKPLQELVLQFYQDNFWKRLSLDSVTDQRIATELFDTGVNMGTGIAATFLQRVLNVSNREGREYPDLLVDGDLGPKTITILNHHPRPSEVLKALNCLQGARYIAICEANPSQEVFFQAWMSRVN